MLLSITTEEGLSVGCNERRLAQQSWHTDRCCLQSKSDAIEASRAEDRNELIRMHQTAQTVPDTPQCQLASCMPSQYTPH